MSDIEDRINYIAKTNGYITPEMVVTDAMSPESPLHGEFTWDKDSAAWAHWLHTARQIIKSVKVVVTTEKRTVRAVAYVRDPSKGNNEQGYLAVEHIRNDEDMAREALVMEFKRAGAALQRAQRLAVAFNLEAEIDTMAKGINRIRKNVEEKRLNS